MINLLPLNEKKLIRAGRANRLLIRYVLLILALMVGLTAVFSFVWLYLRNTEQSAQRKIAESEASSKQLQSTVSQIESFKSNLSSANQILAKRIDYSGIILRYASTIPSGVIIDTMTLSPTIAGEPTELVAQAKDAATVIKLKDSLNDSPYFSDAYFTEVSRNAEGPYQYTIRLSVTIKQELLDD